MSDHFPFAGNHGTHYGPASRMTISAFFEKNHFPEDLQEAYYKWWYDWAENFVENDSDLKVAESWHFKNYPIGQHSYHSFHLNHKYWASCMDDLGSFIRGIIFLKLDKNAMYKLEKGHDKLLADLRKKAEAEYEPTPNIGLFRHV